MKNKLLILGASSYVGKFLSREFEESETYCTYNKSIIKNGINFNIIDEEIYSLPINFSLVSHAVILLGDTEPNSCFSDLDYSNRLNIDSIVKIINFLKNLNIKIIFCSTEFIYDGTKGMYSELDTPNPILEYGRQKLAVEKHLIHYPYATILRFAKIYGSNLRDGTLFSDWCCKITNNETIECANDQFFSPVFVGDVIQAIQIAVKNNIYGVFNLSCGRRYSRLDLLKLLIKHKFSGKDVAIVEKSIDDFNLPEIRPKDVSMISKKAQIYFGINFISPEDFLDNHLNLAS